MWLNKSEVDNWLAADSSISEYKINEDPNPKVIVKKPAKKLELTQSIKVNYLRPPTPPQPGEIIIEKEPNKVTPAAPPLIIREIPERPQDNTEPLIVREAPPSQNLKKIEPQIITIPGKVLPPPPRKVIINREYYYINGECKDKQDQTKQVPQGYCEPQSVQPVQPVQPVQQAYYQPYYNSQQQPQQPIYQANYTYQANQPANPMYSPYYNDYSMYYSNYY